MSPIQTPKLQLLLSTLSEKGIPYIASRGNPQSPIWIVGEAGGEHESGECQCGRHLYNVAFVGPSGQEQDRMLSEAGFQEPVFFCNIYPVRPRQNILANISEFGIHKDIYTGAFWETVELYRPSVIIPAGGTATGEVWPGSLVWNYKEKRHEVSIMKWRGSVLHAAQRVIVPVAHPAYVLRVWEERNVAIHCYRKAWEEFLFLKKNGFIQPYVNRHILVKPSASDVIDYLRSCLALAPIHSISIDIETIRRRFVYLVGLAKSPTDAISFCLWDYDSNASSRIFRLLDHILHTRRQIGQNYYSFDANWFSSLGFRPCPELFDDTLVMHHVLWPELEHSLQFMTIQYTREPFYKDDGKDWHGKGGIEQYMRYNAKDAAVTYEVKNAMQEELECQSTIT